MKYILTILLGLISFSTLSAQKAPGFSGFQIGMSEPAMYDSARGRGWVYYGCYDSLYKGSSNPNDLLDELTFRYAPPESPKDLHRIGCITVSKREECAMLEDLSIRSYQGKVFEITLNGHAVSFDHYSAFLKWASTVVSALDNRFGKLTRTKFYTEIQGDMFKHSAKELFPYELANRSLTGADNQQINVTVQLMKQDGRYTGSVIIANPAVAKMVEAARAKQRSGS
jgi:hypothetical protein